jgi:hypothetical protein
MENDKTMGRAITVVVELFPNLKNVLLFFLCFLIFNLPSALSWPSVFRHSPEKSTRQKTLCQ